MNRRNRHALASAALALALMAGAMPQAAWADGSPSAVTLTLAEQSSLGTVNILGGSSIEVKEVSLLESDEGKLAAFTLTLSNNEDYEIQWIDYWVRLLNDAGTSFTVQVLPQDKDKNRVPAHSSLDIHMVSRISGDTGLQDLIFRLVRWDFSVAGYERKLGDITVPEDYQITTPAGQARLVSVGGVDVKMAAVRMAAGRNSDYYLPKIQFQLENAGMKTAEIPAYQFALRTEEGLLYPLQVKGLGENDRSLYPRFTKDLELTGKLPLSVGPNGWELVITTQQDAGAGGKLTVPVAFFSLPEPSAIQDETIIPVHESKSIDIGSETLETKVEEVKRTKLDASYSVNIVFAMKNTGTGSITMPNYRFAVQTSEGLTYPAKAEGLKDMVINPLFRKETQLTASIPPSVNPSGWKLLLLPPADPVQGLTSEAALAAYQLSDVSAQSGSLGSVYDFTNKNGTYKTVLNSIQRLPWEDQDIVSVNLTVTNKGTSPLPLPTFSGYFLLDDVVRVPAAAIVKDSVISIKPDGSVSLQLYGKIPYTNEYSSLKLVLQEKEGNDQVTDLLEFRGGSKASAIPSIPAEGSYRTEGVGRQNAMKVRDVRTYKEEDSDLFSVQLTVQNLEKRYTGIGSLVAYLKTSDDTIYPATISEMKEKLSPNGYALLNVSAYLPDAVNTSDLKLLLGAGVKDGKLAQDVDPDAYIDAVTFTLPAEVKEPKKTLTALDFYPYTFSIDRVDTDIFIDRFKLDIRYKLSANQLVKADLDDRKIVIEMEDKDNKIKISKSYAMDKEGNDALDGGEGSFILESETFPTGSGYFWFNLIDTYTLRVYEEFKGNRKLLAEREIDYYSGYQSAWNN